jgi:hypothetical protein
MLYPLPKINPSQMSNMDSCFVVYPTHGCVFGFHLRYDDTHVRLPGGYRVEWAEVKDKLPSALVKGYCSSSQVSTILRLLSEKVPFAVIHTTGEYSLEDPDQD